MTIKLAPQSLGNKKKGWRYVCASKNTPLKTIFFWMMWIQICTYPQYERPPGIVDPHRGWGSGSMGGKNHWKFAKKLRKLKFNKCKQIYFIIRFTFPRLILWKVTNTKSKTFRVICIKPFFSFRRIFEIPRV